MRAAKKCVLSYITFDFKYSFFYHPVDARKEFHTFIQSYDSRAPLSLYEQEWVHVTALQREERVRERE